MFKENKQNLTTTLQKHGRQRWGKYQHRRFLRQGDINFMQHGKRGSTFTFPEKQKYEYKEGQLAYKIKGQASAMQGRITIPFIFSFVCPIKGNQCLRTWDAGRGFIVTSSSSGAAYRLNDKHAPLPPPAGSKKKVHVNNLRKIYRMHKSQT